jgi:hypothetical protein
VLIIAVLDPARHDRLVRKPKRVLEIKQHRGCAGKEGNLQEQEARRKHRPRRHRLAQPPDAMPPAMAPAKNTQHLRSGLDVPPTKT